jgi:hypothetical protein
MRRTRARHLASLALTASLVATTVGPAALRATCGGGGGGGEGRLLRRARHGVGHERVYHVPWKVWRRAPPTRPTASSSYWFPIGPEEARGSSMQTFASARAVERRVRRHGDSSRPTMADPPRPLQGRPRGSARRARRRRLAEVTRIEASAGRLDTSAVREAVGSAIDAREDSLKAALDAAKDKNKGGDADGAAAALRAGPRRPLPLPSLGKKAAKALKAMGRPVPEETSSLWEGPRPDLSDAIEREDGRADGRRPEARSRGTSPRRSRPTSAPATSTPAIPCRCASSASCTRHQHRPVGSRRRRSSALARASEFDPLTAAPSTAAQALGQSTTIHQRLRAAGSAV